MVLNILKACSICVINQLYFGGSYNFIFFLFHRLKVPEKSDLYRADDTQPLVMIETDERFAKNIVIFLLVLDFFSQLAIFSVNLKIMDTLSVL